MADRTPEPLEIHGAPPAKRAVHFDPTTVRVSVIVPVRNEVRTISRTVQLILEQTFPAERLDVFVVDGCSDDGTREALDKYARTESRVHVIENRERTIPVALNRGIEASSGDIIVRVDGRCHVAPDYVNACVDLLARTGAANVGGLVRSRGEGRVSESIALAMTSRFGIGNSRYHYLQRREWVDTVYLGAFRREILDEVGGYDPELTRNQDDELNFRIREAGYGIVLSPDIVSTYTPPSTLKRLWSSQFYQYGYWKVRVIQKHPGSVQPRHLVPPVLVTTLATSVVTSLVTRNLRYLTPVTGYLSSVALAAFWTARKRPRLISTVAAVFACMHVGYGTGFMIALLRLLAARVRGQQ